MFENHLVHDIALIDEGQVGIGIITSFYKMNEPSNIWLLTCE